VPITNGQVRVYRDSSVPAYWDLPLNSEGYYEGNFQSLFFYRVYPIYGDDEERSTHIWSEPRYLEGILDAEGAICDFGIRPAVVAALDRQFGDPTISGVALNLQNTQVDPSLPSFTAGVNQVVFYPDNHDDALGPMPFTGSLRIDNLQPFCVAVPQNSGQ
jgi:hypothetical protein